MELLNTRMFQWKQNTSYGLARHMDGRTTK